MQGRWMYSPIKHHNSELEVTSELYELNTLIHIGDYHRTAHSRVQRKCSTISTCIPKQRTWEILHNIYIKRTRGAFHKIRRRTLTETSGDFTEEPKKAGCLELEEGWDQLDYVVKSSHQKDKVMAFTFIKMLYKQYKRKRQKRIKTASHNLGELFCSLIRQSKRQSFSSILDCNKTVQKLSSQKLALKVVDNLLSNNLSRVKKQAFEMILRTSFQSLRRSRLDSVKSAKSVRSAKSIDQPPTQYIYIIKQKAKEARSTQKIMVKVPLMSQKVCLQEFNVSTTRRKRTGSRATIQSTSRTCRACIYTSSYRRCRLCDILKEINRL